MAKSKGRKRTTVRETIRVVGPRIARNRKKRLGKGRKRQLFGNGSCAMELARSVMDPWMFAACIPDGSKGKAKFSVKETGTVSTGAGGSVGGIIVGANPGTQKIIDSGNTTALPVISANWSGATNYSTINSVYARVRPVSIGLKCEYVGPTNTDGGSIIYGQMSQGVTPSSNFGGASEGGIANSSMEYEVSPLRNGCKLFWKPSDAPDMANFTNILSSSTATNLGPSENYIFAYVFGAAASQALFTYEFVANYEGTFATQQFLPGGIDIKSAGPSSVAEAGWFENASNIWNLVKPFAPLIGGEANTVVSFFDMAMNGAKQISQPSVRKKYGLGALSNGLSYPSNVSTGSRFEL